MAEEKYRHFFIFDSGEAQKYTSKNKGGSSKKIPLVNRIEHGEKIKRQLQQAWEQAKIINSERKAVSLPTKNGIYLEFESVPDYELATKSLEYQRSGIRLLNTRTEAVDGKKINKATVFIPKGKVSYYLKKVQSYIEKDDKRSQKPKNEKLIAPMNEVKLALVEAFWQGSKQWMPESERQWCEIWLSSDSDIAESEIRNICKELGIPLQSETLKFPERRVILAKVNKTDLMELLLRSDNLAEFRRASEAAAFFVDLENKDQTDWAKELLERLKINYDTNVYICILDTGVNNGHILIKPVLADKDCQAYDPSWGVHDHDGHGTKMSGLAIYGNLQKVLEGRNMLELNHLLESVKILPPKGENEAKLYGAITSQSVSRMIIENPERKRIVCMAVTAPKYETGDGRPSSWSAAIDELTSGYLDEQQKLFFVSAGNVDDISMWNNYPASNISCTIQNPGQAWNAVTVGAYTNLDIVNKNKYGNAVPLAACGELSPFSPTSLLWDDKWPVKPDIVLEGGNVIKDIYGCTACDDLSLLTTYYKPAERQFDTINATSAATAQAAWMAAQIQAAYPDAWPETIRALLIHSAEWTPQMEKQFLNGKSKGDYNALLRTCGYGVPSLEKALWCAKNSVNLIIQSQLQPYDKTDDNRYVTKDMHIHELPWPKEVLESMFDIPVRMRITLSYFIEPAPGEVGWKDRYRYASCALRFDVNGTDTREMFICRINAAAEAEEEDVHNSGGGGVKWILGYNNRHHGSIHSDIWEGTAAQLATSNLVGVYPAVGWWRERPWLNRWDYKIRYSLIVSLQTPAQDVDLYTPILTKIAAKVPISVTKKH